MYVKSSGKWYEFNDSYQKIGEILPGITADLLVTGNRIEIQKPGMTSASFRIPPVGTTFLIKEWAAEELPSTLFKVLGVVESISGEQYGITYTSRTVKVQYGG